MPVIPATWEAEIRRIMVLAQPGQKADKTLSQSIVECCVACLPFQAPQEAENRTVMRQFV
jgi:hypothetical protein